MPRPDAAMRALITICFFLQPGPPLRQNQTLQFLKIKILKIGSYLVGYYVSTFSFCVFHIIFWWFSTIRGSCYDVGHMLSSRNFYWTELGEKHFPRWKNWLAVLAQRWHTLSLCGRSSACNLTLGKKVGSKMEKGITFVERNVFIWRGCFLSPNYVTAKWT